VTTAQTRRRRGTGHELREVMLRVATNRLAGQDAADLTMRTVASTATVTPPSVYRDFPAKETIVRTVVTVRAAAREPRESR
jgi:AcrR family transcriptional regulator